MRAYTRERGCRDLEHTRVGERRGAWSISTYTSRAWVACPPAAPIMRRWRGGWGEGKEDERGRLAHAQRLAHAAPLRKVSGKEGKK